jgi:phage FluMu protein Com
MVMRKVRPGEIPPNGATAVQDEPDRPVFRANGPYDYVCVECGNVLAAGMGLENMTKRVRIKCARCKTINVAVYDAMGDTAPGASPAGPRKQRGEIS